MADNGADPKAEELTAIVQEIRDRVRARHPSSGAAGGIPLADLMPLFHARDAAQGKVAAIGSVNPRPPGLVNWLVQAVKKTVARALDWHVREQVEFNRAVLNCVEATLEAAGDLNRAVARLASLSASRFEELRSELNDRDSALRAELGAATEEARQMKDARRHWAEWRVEWERKLSVNEMQFLRSVADLQTAFQHRVTLIEGNFRGLLQSQHADFTGALDRSGLEIQKRLWKDLENIRAEYERLIHQELRVVRQRAAARPAAEAPPAGSAPGWMDALAFAQRFRGSEEYVRQGQRFYLPYFEGRRAVLDIGCGRGEFLELMREAGVAARGIDLSEESVGLCRSKGLEALAADLFPYLDSLPELSLDGIFCAQVVEHLPPERLPEFARLAAAKLERGGMLAIETPNPECLAIFATHFYLDPTHTRPVPSALLAFHLEEAGFGRIEVHRLSPAVETMPELAGLPEEFRQAFFGGLDYAILARRL